MNATGWDIAIGAGAWAEFAAVVEEQTIQRATDALRFETTDVSLREAAVLQGAADEVRALPRLYASPSPTTEKETPPPEDEIRSLMATPGCGAEGGADAHSLARAGAGLEDCADCFALIVKAARGVHP